jgi:hypothetical protein
MGNGGSGSGDRHADTSRHASSSGAGLPSLRESLHGRPAVRTSSTLSHVDRSGAAISRLSLRGSASGRGADIEGRPGREEERKRVRVIRRGRRTKGGSRCIRLCVSDDPKTPSRATADDMDAETGPESVHHVHMSVDAGGGVQITHDSRVSKQVSVFMCH